MLITLTNALEILTQHGNVGRWRKLWFPFARPPFHFRIVCFPVYVDPGIVGTPPHPL